MKIKTKNKCCYTMIKEISKYDLLILDPPFNKWHEIPKFKNKNIICFTNFQNREDVTKIYGKPKIEFIWYFKDGRWVSNNFPRLTHESILLYGKTNSAFVGKINTAKPAKKGRGHIGKTKMTERVYYPKNNKQLNSVLEYPRNVSTGCWSKPKNLINDLINFIRPTSVCDPFMGSGIIAEVCYELNINYYGIEKNKTIYKNTEKNINYLLKQTDLFLEGKNDN